jgi:hypothetical protein
MRRALIGWGKSPSQWRLEWPRSDGDGRLIRGANRQNGKVLAIRRGLGGARSTSKYLSTLL